MFEKYRLLVEKGISEMICAKIGDKVLVYGGCNFPDGTPPEGKKKFYNDMYVFDRDFNLLSKTVGKMAPSGGVAIEDGEKLWYFMDSTLYLIELEGETIKEGEFFKFDFDLSVNFACKYGDALYFGGDKMYRLALADKSVETLADFPATPRNQPVFARYGESFYVFGGASNICHLDAYKYDLLEDKWTRLNDIPVSFTGSSFEKYDENRLVVMGGFNKEVFDEAVKNLSELDYKRAYFKKAREDFKWNKECFVYDFSTESFTGLGEDKESATCGSGLIKIDDDFYLVGGELKPGFRNEYILKTELKLD